jgi:hypothetical protein
MAFPRKKKLTQVETDLQKYCFERVLTVIKDVAQAFAIADQSAVSGLTCLGASFARTAVQVAVTLGMPKHKFMEWMSEEYNECVANETKHNDERKD